MCVSYEIIILEGIHLRYRFGVWQQLSIFIVTQQAFILMDIIFFFEHGPTFPLSDCCDYRTMCTSKTGTVAKRTKSSRVRGPTLTGVLRTQGFLVDNDFCLLIFRVGYRKENNSYYVIKN